MKEKNFHPMFHKWIFHNFIQQRTEMITCTQLDLPMAFELKIEKGKSFNFDKVAEHQIQSLLECKSDEGFFFKIPDQPFITDRPDKMRFTIKKPFDCFYMRKVKAFIVIWFYKPRQRQGEREMLWIDIDNFVAIKKHYIECKNELIRHSLKEQEWQQEANYRFKF